MKKYLATLTLVTALTVLGACGKEESVKEKEEPVVKQEETKKNENEQVAVEEPKNEGAEVSIPVEPANGDTTPTDYNSDEYSEEGIAEVKMWNGLHFRIADVDVFEVEDTEYISYKAGKSGLFTIKAYFDEETTFEEYIKVPLDGHEQIKIKEETFKSDGVQSFEGEYKTPEGYQLNRYVFRVDNMFYDVVFFATAEDYKTYLHHVEYTVQSMTFDRDFTKVGKY